MSSSTEILLIQQQISLLTSHMDWIIGGVTLTITILLGLFGLIQFVYQRKIQKSEIDALEKNLSDQIEEKLKRAEERLQSFSKETIGEVEQDLRKDINSMDADIARRFAIDCEKDSLNAAAFSWWLRAAVGYEKSGIKRMYSVSITNAKKSLEKTESRSETDSLFESSPIITENLNALEESHKSEVEVLREIFMDKCKKTTKKEPDTVDF